MHYIGFLLNNNEFTVPINMVQEVINLPNLTKIPLAPAYMEGVTCLREKIVPVLDFKKMIGLHNGEGIAKAEKVIVVNSVNKTVGLIVDTVTGVIFFEDSALNPEESCNEHLQYCLSGVAKVNNKNIFLLDTKALIPKEDDSFFNDTIFGCNKAVN